MQKKDISGYVGRQIRKYRLLKGMTQKELGLRIGVKHNTISSYENGINEPEQDILFSIVEVLGVSINDLFPPVNDKLSMPESELEQDIRMISRAAQKMDPIKRKKMLELLKVTFEEEFEDDD